MKQCMHQLDRRFHVEEHRIPPLVEVAGAFPFAHKKAPSPHWKWRINKHPRAGAHREHTSRQNWFIYKPESHISRVHYVMYRRTPFGAFSAYIHHPSGRRAKGWERAGRKYPILNSVSFRTESGRLDVTHRRERQTEPWADYEIL